MDQFDKASQKELEKFVTELQAVERAQTMKATLTSTCWDKCIAGSVSNRFARGEEACLENCVNRFYDTSVILVNRLEAAQNAHKDHAH